MADITQTLLTDIAHKSDFIRSATGDISLISGLANLKEALFRRLITTPGTIIHRPTYGCGILDFQNAPLTLEAQRRIIQRIEQQFPLDPRVNSVLSVTITPDDNNPALVTISVNVDVVGFSEAAMVFKPFSEGVS